VDESGDVEILHRSPERQESRQRLARKAAEAETSLGIHGVSAFSTPMPWPHSRAARTFVEQHFKVHNTLGPTHRTIELPKPVTDEVAALFNRVFGRL
jgi:hypothetical protein